MAYAQVPDTWVMSHARSMQPLFEAYYEGGELVYDDSAPLDSTLMHNPGLMIFRLLSDSTALSYSLEAEESWVFEQNAEQLVFYGQRDTLSGPFSSQTMRLTSTLDAGQTEYVFTPVTLQPIDLTALSNTQWRAQADEHPMNGAAVGFGLEAPFLIPTAGDTVHKAEVYHVQIGPYFVTDYTLSHLSPQEFGIIYWLQQSTDTLSGIFFPIQQEDNHAPVAQALILRQVEK